MRPRFQVIGLRSASCLLRDSLVQTQTRANKMGNFYRSALGEALGRSCEPADRRERGRQLAQLQAFWLLGARPAEMSQSEDVDLSYCSCCFHTSTKGGNAHGGYIRMCAYKLFKGNVRIPLRNAFLGSFMCPPGFWGKEDEYWFLSFGTQTLKGKEPSEFRL